MRIPCYGLLFFLFFQGLHAQTPKSKNVILITLDGFRWQELFNGPDSILLNKKSIVQDQSVIKQFWAPTGEEGRKKLLPFFWTTIQSKGQLYGNRKFGNKVNCANLQWFSYPGYSELLSGFVDARINSNDKVNNRNSNVLEFIHQQPAFENKVAAFSTWDVFPYILRENSSGILVNAGVESMRGQLSESEKLLNELQQLIPNPVTNRNDVFTFYFAFEYLKRERPRALFISFDETDAYAHSGRYDEYLKAAHKTDRLISKLWEWIQSDSSYRDQTTIIITTDHGRGRGLKDGKMSWRNHGLPSLGSGETWIAAIGPDTPALGEVKEKMQLHQKQIAATLAACVGLNYENRKQVGKVISHILAPPVNQPTTVLTEAALNK
jgi:hypothetical protein